MDGTYGLTLSPIEVGSLTLKNRVAFAPTTMGLSPEARAARLVGVARGGTALVTLGDMGVEKSFHASGFDLVTPEGQSACRALVADLHAAGAKVSAQIFAPDYDTTGFIKLLNDPDTTREQLNDYMYGRVGEYVTTLPLDRIEELIDLFGRRAHTARELGFDMIQINGDRLIGSLLSSTYNLRRDSYGGDARARASFAVDVVSVMREVLGGDFPIEFKLAIRQVTRGLGKTGPTLDEVPDVVSELVSAGVSSFHVTGSNHSRLEDVIPEAAHGELRGEGCFVNLARAVGSCTSLPVCAVGKMVTPDFVERTLAFGDAQMVAMSRQLLADPNWVRKVEEGRTGDIRRCVWCNKRCVGALRTHSSFGCIYDDRD